MFHASFRSKNQKAPDRNGTPIQKLLIFSPHILFGLGLLLHGTKSAFAFCEWSLAAMAFAIAALLLKPPTNRQALYFLLFTTGVVISHIFSVDPTQSLFWTTQYLVFSCLWLALQSTLSDLNSDLFWHTLLALGLVTLAQTALQWINHAPLYGLLPLNPNFNAAWMSAIVVGLLGKNRWSLLDRLVLLGLSALVLFGHSRSGLLALIAGACFSFSFRYSKKKILYSLGFIIILALCIPHSWLLNRFYIYENGGRLKILITTLKSLIDFPLTGYGPGNFEIAYQKYAFPIEGAVRFAHTTMFAHNDFLQLACEIGWPTAGLLFIGLYIILTKPIPTDRPLLIASKGILITLGVSACFNPIFKMPILTYLAVYSASGLHLPLFKKVSVRKSGPWQIGSFYAVTLVLILVLWCGVRSYCVEHREWSRLIQLNSHDAEAWHELAYETSDILQILSFHRKAVQESPSQIYYVEAYARALESVPGVTLIPLALATYTSAIQLAPTRATNLLGEARLLFREGKTNEALHWAEQARTLEPYYWECELWRARCYERLGDKKRAGFILNGLIKRHDEFIEEYPLSPQSPYEQTILMYDNAVIQNERSHLRDQRFRTNGVE